MKDVRTADYECSGGRLVWHRVVTWSDDLFLDRTSVEEDDDALLELRRPRSPTNNEFNLVELAVRLDPPHVSTRVPRMYQKYASEVTWALSVLGLGGVGVLEMSPHGRCTGLLPQSQTPRAGRLAMLEEEVEVLRLLGQPSPLVLPGLAFLEWFRGRHPEVCE